jgi:cation diffusion facilitator family transporter
MPTRERRKLRSRRAETISPGSTRHMRPEHVLLLLAFLASLSYEAEARTRRTTGSFQQEALQKSSSLPLHNGPESMKVEEGMEQTKDMHREKAAVALSSVIAALGLTSIKLVVGLFTGSLGILAEAAHSGLDLVAALMTLFAVRVASRPADGTHHYGHGKVENLSAFLETGLLVLTAIWIIYEAIRRLLFHDSHVEITIWAFMVMAISIVVDFTRSRLLLRVARQTGSQALEADALHFSTDMWSSAVVIAGLLVVWLTERFSLPGWLGQADAVSALGVSGIVIWVSIRLAKDTIDALLDSAPDTIVEQVQKQVRALPDVLELRRVRMRRAGNKLFADVVVAAPRTFTFEQTHMLTDHVEQAAREAVRLISPQGDIDIVVHVEPTASPEETVAEQIHYLAEAHGVNAHDIHVRKVSGHLEADFDLEVPTDMALADAHTMATRLEEAVLQTNPQVQWVNTHLEASPMMIVPRRDVTAQYPELATHLRRLADEIAGAGSAHEIHLYHAQESMPERDVVLHTTFAASTPLSQVHIQTEEIKRTFRQAYPTLGAITIHTEPPEEQAERPTRSDQ